jgi:hypothetical protein
MLKTHGKIALLVGLTALLLAAPWSVEDTKTPALSWARTYGGTGIDPWARTYGGPGIERANAIQQTVDGGFVVIGRTTSFGAGGNCADPGRPPRPCSNVWVLKLDANGGVQWQRTYDAGPDPNDEDVGLAIQQLPDGPDPDMLPDGYIVAATTTTQANQGDAWIFQLDADGDVVWSRTLGTPGGFDELISLQLLPDGPDPDILPDGAIAAGFLDEDPGPGVDWDVWVVLLALAPAPPPPPPAPVLWQIILDEPGPVAYNDIALSIFPQPIIPGISYIIAGQTFAVGAGDVWVVQFNLDPNPLDEMPPAILWQNAYGGALQDEALAIRPGPEGLSFIVTARTQSFGEGGWDIWNFQIILEPGGQQIGWSITYGGLQTDEVTSPTSIQPTADGGFIMAGRTASLGAGGFQGIIPFDAWVLRLTPLGSELWGRTYGGFGANDEALSVQQTADGGYIVAGSTASFGAGNGDIWVLKLAPNGSIWGCIPEGTFIGADAFGIVQVTPQVMIAPTAAVLAIPAAVVVDNGPMVGVANSSASISIQCATGP